MYTRIKRKVEKQMKTEMYNVTLHSNHVVAVTPDHDIDHEAIVVSKVAKHHVRGWDSDRIYGGALLALAAVMAIVITVVMPEEGITAPIIIGMIGAAGLFHK